MIYYKRIFTLYVIGVEIPNDIKDYIDNVKILFTDLFLCSFISRHSGRLVYQLYNENDDVYFEIKIDNEGNISYIHILDIYESKLNKHIGIFPYLFISFFSDIINNIHVSEKCYIEYVSQIRLGKVKKENK